MLSERSREYINRKLAGTHIILQNFTSILESDAKREAGWTDRTGHARQSIHSGVEGRGRDITVYLAHGVKYGEILEEGSRPHIIRPKNKKALYWSGAAHPVKEVHHPGTTGDPALQKSLERNKERMLRNVADWWADE